MAVLDGDLQGAAATAVSAGQGHGVAADEEFEDEEPTALWRYVDGALGAVWVGSLVAPQTIRMDPHRLLWARPPLQKPVC